MTLAPLTWRGVPVPFITPWSAETPRTPQLKAARRRLAYTDETIHDRHGDVLWIRTPYARGTGAPEFAGIHAMRQRQAITRDLCMICGVSVSGYCGGKYLFLLAARDGRPIREGEVTAVPPIHPHCARIATQHCPHLRRGWAAALVAYAPNWGVAGICYSERTLQPLPGPPSDPEGLTYVEYVNRPQLMWMVAARAAVALYEVEPVSDLTRLAETVPL
ncbi:hypothetical protein [Streptomyces sp. CRN 30]|uniref:hypothetical protein n=1 Tax=Streptomyces sp. CRN 30 TaxID=3075613 RepID=UPI002A81C357|nr:hypothetical protein [Streptomyces sp. CRN 30]